MLSKKILALAAFATGFGQMQAQNFYDVSTIQDIRIYFGFTNWDTRLDTANAGSESYTVADSVVINGTTFTNCGVRYKGNSSYNANRAKNPLHIKLNHTNSNSNYQGYDDLKLANGFSDPSVIREVLSYNIARRYMDAPESNFAKVYVNGAYYGLMANSESVESQFLLKHYFSSKHIRVKCNPNMTGGPGAAGTGSNLGYFGTAVSSYNTKYELQSDTGWNQLIGLCDTLNNYFTSFNDIADIDRFIWMLAFNNVLVNLDSYTGTFRQNYYLYRNHKGQWIPTLWDLNMSFAGFTQTGSGSLSTLTSQQNMSAFLHQNDAAWPLLNKLLNDPFYKKMYIAHMRTLNGENFLNGDYKIWGNSLHALVDNAVSTDANSLTTYAQFQSSLTASTASGMGTTPGIYQLMDTRATYLNGTTDFTYTTPIISNITSSTPSPAYGSTVTILATVTNRTNVYLGHRSNKADRFVRVPMYDDGAHGDGASGDNVYGAVITANSMTTQYYIYAENANAGMFSPERAEHEFYTLTATLAAATAADLVVNEAMPNNETSVENEAGKTKDWIEIYNKTNTPLSLAGFYLSDNVSNLAKWAFPTTAVILPNEHLLVWADDYDDTYLDMHTNFELSSSSDRVILSKGSPTTLVDSCMFSNVGQDISRARCADGSGNFQMVSSPTPRAANVCTNVAVAELANGNFSIYPNPADAVLNLQSDNLPIEEVIIYDALGKILSQTQNLHTNQHQIALAELSAGAYVVRINQNIIKKLLIVR